MDTVERKIGLSKKRADWAGEGAEGEGVEPPEKPKKERKLRGGLHGPGDDPDSGLIDGSFFNTDQGRQSPDA